MNFLKFYKDVRWTLPHFNAIVFSSSYTNTTYNKELLTQRPENRHQQDEFTQSIKRATDAMSLFEVITGKGKEMDSRLVVLSLRSLYNLQKGGHTNLHSSQILKHPEFEKLCRSLKSQVREIELTDVIESLKFLSYLGVSTQSEITVILLNLIRQNINDIELTQIVFLDFLLKKFESTPLIEALKLAMPMLFQINLSLKLDHENVSQLTEFLGFVSKNKVSDKCVTSIVTALTLHAESFTVDNAMSIIWSLCEMRRLPPNCDKLVKNSINSFYKRMDGVAFDNIEITLSKVIDKFLQKNNEFYSEELFNKSAEIAIRGNVGFLKGIYILKKFNKISFVHPGLLNYIGMKSIEQPQFLSEARPTALFTFLTGFSTANYKTENWDIITTALIQNRLLQIEKNEMPWIRFCLELISLNCYDENLFEKIFSDDFLHKYLGREYNLLDYLQLLLLYQSVVLLKPDYMGKLPDNQFIKKAKEINAEKVDFPLQRTLEFIYGDQFIATKITTIYGHIIDHVMVFDENGKPVEIDSSVQNLEELQNSYKNHSIVSILPLPKSCYPINIPGTLKGMFGLRLKTLEALNLKVVPINYQYWMEMSDAEKIPYLKQKIERK